MTPKVAQAVEELRSSFADSVVVARGESNGGAIVTIDAVDLGPRYIPQRTRIKFVISFQYPYADIYPLFVRPDLARADGRPHGQGITETSFRGEPALQLSRRSIRLNPAIDTAVLKVTKVIKWLQAQ